MSSDFLSSVLERQHFNVQFQEYCALCNFAKVTIGYIRDEVKGESHWIQSECPNCKRTVDLQLPPLDWNEAKEAIDEARKKEFEKPITKQQLQTILMNVKYNILESEAVDSRIKETWAIASTLFYWALARSEEELKRENLQLVTNIREKLESNNNNKKQVNNKTK